jgi:hypothetical protein
MPEVTFSIFADGKDVTANLSRTGMLTMNITDGEGLEADALSIEIDDLAGRVEAPRTGAILRAVGGYKDTGRIRDFGLYSVDTVVYTGWPQQISIEAKAVAAKSLAKQREPKAFKKESFPTYKDVFGDVAKLAGLNLKISPEIAALANHYEAQADEDANEFLLRIADKLNAAVSIKAMNLVVVPKGEGKSASGQALDRVDVSYGINLIGYSATLRDEPKHSEVEATWYDRDKNERTIEIAPTGMTGPKFLLRTPFSNPDDAKRAAEAQAKELKRMLGEATFTIDGEPFAQAEAWAAVTGVRPNVDGLWRITTASHSFSATGAYTTTLTCGSTSEGNS